MKKLICVLVLCILLVTGLTAEALPKFTGWKQAETDHFRFIFEEASREAAEAYAEIADEAWNKVAKAYSLPRNKIDVVVNGRMGTINAYTYPIPLGIGMFTVPFVIPDFTYRGEWIEYVFTHELIHAANITFESHDDELIVKLFGSYFQAIDFQSLPAWEIEGLTTVLETELTEAGRGRSPYFELLWKAHALEGSMVEYADIGTADQAPRGQAYVYGYLMMRSLADRWGIKSLADIERNRGFLNSFEESVLQVTGLDAYEVWQDIKIGLEKKYADERMIPEGITISPRDVYFYKPAVVLDDGSMVTVRRIGDTTSVVFLNPDLPNGSHLYDTLDDGIPVTKETTLFSGTMPDAYSVTADKNKKIYAALQIARADRGPGNETSFQIFTWDGENGLKQLTEGSNFIQPSVSFDGTVLVALEQVGLHWRLVRIDTETGAVTPLLEDAVYDFASPAVSKDGSKVALIRAGGGRGAVSYLDMSKVASGAADASVLTVVANGSGPIVDPAYPSWNYDGSLTYCSNDRGRLEVYEVSENEDGSFSSKPVVADPVGALWAYNTPRGIYYASYATNGYCLKMKPASEWGVVPDFNGPSMPGEIFHSGDYTVDYKDFKPYENGNIVEFEARNEEELLTEATIHEPVRTLQNEKNYYNLPETIIRMPSFMVTPVSDSEYAFGAGLTSIGVSHQLNDRYNLNFANVLFYPSIMNLSGMLVNRNSIGNTLFDVQFNRILGSVGGEFTESNLLSVGLSIPFYDRTMPLSSGCLSTITLATGGIIRSDTAAFSVTDIVPYKYVASGVAGLDFKGESWNSSMSSGFTTSAFAVGLAEWNSLDNTVYLGGEGELEMLFGSGNRSLSGFSLLGRYMDCPETIVPTGSVLKHSGNPINCAHPLNLVGRLESVATDEMIKVNMFEEALCSLTHDGSFILDDILSTGLEISCLLGREAMTCGITCDYSIENEAFSFGRLYFTMKLNIERH